MTDPDVEFCLKRIGKSVAGWDTLVVHGPAEAAKSAEAFAGLPAALLRPLVARRWNRAFQDAVDGLIRRADGG